MNRLTDNDKKWGPFTLARWKNRFSAHFSYGDEEDPEAQLLFVAFGWALRIQLQRSPRGDEKSWGKGEMEYGISLTADGNGYDFLQVHYGPQTWDSDTTKSWCKHLPWKQWDCVRQSIYTPTGEHFATMEHRKWDDFYQRKRECPSAQFMFRDYDGAEITATCIIEELEWHRGKGSFRWLRFFYRAKIRRDLDLQFSAEVGPGKGSWKGGTTGHGIEMLKGETPEQAFRRYCEKGYDRKGRNTPLTFIRSVAKAA